MKLRVVFFLLSILSIKFIHAQVQELDLLLEKKKYTTFNDQLKKLSLDKNQQYYYEGKLYLHKRDLSKSIEVLRRIDTTQLPSKYKAWYYYVLGDSHGYLNREEKEFELKLKAQKLFKKDGDDLMSNQINFDLHYILSSQDFLDYDGESYLKIFFENAKKRNISKQLLTAHLEFSYSSLLSKNIEKGLFHLDEATRYAKNIDTPEAYYKVNNYRSVFAYSLNEYQKARVYAENMVFYARKLNSPSRIDSALKTLAYTYTLEGNYSRVVEELLKADKLQINENVYNRKKHLYKSLSANYDSIGKNDSAYYYMNKMVHYSDSVHIDQQNDLLIAMETEELSKKNLILEGDKSRQQMYLYLSSAGLIVFMAISIAILSFHRKQKIIAQKEKELEAINARYEEKDRQRQRIAGELHDDFGSVLVAIKNCLESLGIVKNHFLQEEQILMTKARSLLDKAYQKVRSIAHIEDAASKSAYWLDAIKDFVSTVTEFNQLNIEIDTYGLEDFVDVALEKDLRRIVIELITNILKHAKATEVSIEIVKRNSLLNIIVEDNGVGFDTTHLDTSTGTGLSNINRKIEELNGELKIDSQENRGTTIIIEIPV